MSILRIVNKQKIHFFRFRTFNRCQMSTLPVYKGPRFYTLITKKNTYQKSYLIFYTLGMSDSQSDPALFPLTSAIVYLIAFMLVCSVTLGQMAQRWPSGPCYMKGPSINNVIIFPQISYPSVLFDHSLLDLLPPSPFFNSLPPAMQGKKCF